MDFAPVPAMVIFCFFFFLLFPLKSDASESTIPTVQDVQREAVQYLGFDQREMEGWKKRSRWAAALPRLQAGFAKDFKDALNLTTSDNVSISGGDVFIGPRESDFDQNFNQGTSFDVKAVWFLNELIFTRDSLSANAQKLNWIRERNRVLQEVTKAYYARQLLQADLSKRGDGSVAREKKKLLLDQMNATLDAYTGGWFSRQSRHEERKTR